MYSDYSIDVSCETLNRKISYHNIQLIFMKIYTLSSLPILVIIFEVLFKRNCMISEAHESYLQNHGYSFSFHTSFSCCAKI